MSNNRIPKEGKIFLWQNLILVKLGLFYYTFFFYFAINYARD